MVEGRERLVAWLKEPGAGRSGNALAKILKVNQSSVWGWCKGHAVPEAVHRDMLKELAGIPPDSWPVKHKAHIEEAWKNVRAAIAAERAKRKSRGKGRAA
jgi:hypothetical protein